MFTTRPVGLDFLDAAPVRLAFAGTLQAPPKTVFDAVARDIEALPHWYGAVSAAEHGPGPHGVGIRRRVRLVGNVAFHEQVIAWDDPARFAYRIERTTVPGIRAMAEQWAVLETARGTRLIWTIALDANLATAALVRSMAPGMGLATRRAVAKLDRRLGAGA
ncbi:SRPBCC family protein [Catenulispora yoronensis]|uniref:SRPBCC family protein n=1 Tax=Catenulispora yoronensis TaxID=450799 RepID=A0ABP5GWH8_9ACTN